MIFLGGDILITLFSPYKSYLVLLNLIYKRNIRDVILIGLVIDLLILHVYFINTIIFIGLYLLFRRVSKRLNFSKFIIIMGLLYLFYGLILGLTHHYLIKEVMMVLIRNALVNFGGYFLSYKLFFKNIKLSR